MITFFTTAKAFAGEAATRQENAIRSWLALDPEVEVILFGEGEGYAETARRLGIRHMPDVGTNERGLPRVDSMFALAAERGRHALQSYINCDIILLPDFLEAVRRLPFERFLMVAQRWDVEVPGRVPVGQPGWDEGLRARARGEGSLLAPHGIDFFLQRGNIWKEMPPMVVGRGHYDMWLIYYCRAHGIPVVDVTPVVTVVHQNHDYAHVAGGKTTVNVGEEAMRNLELAGGYAHLFTIQDADWTLTPQRLGAGRKGNSHLPLGSRGRSPSMKLGSRRIFGGRASSRAGFFNGLLERNWCRGDSQRCAEVFQVLRPHSPWAQSRAGFLAAKAWAEWVVRLKYVARGKVGPLLKFPGWCLRELFPPQRTRRSAEGRS